MSGVFEIREYLDEKGQTKNNEMVDITAELERFAKMGGDVIEKQEALDEEKQFIRELAAMAEKTEDTRKQFLETKRKVGEGACVDEDKGADDLDDVLEKLYQSSIERPKAALASAKAKTSTTKSSGGWKSGFLSGPSKPTKKAEPPTTAPTTAPTTPPTVSTAPSVDVAVAASGRSEPVQVTSNKKSSTEKPPAAEENGKKRVVFNPKVSEQSENRVDTSTSALKEAATPVEVVPEEPRENVFSQQKHMYQRHNPMAATSGIKPLPKIPKGETTKVAFTGTISERS